MSARWLVALACASALPVHAQDAMSGMDMPPPPQSAVPTRSADYSDGYRYGSMRGMDMLDDSARGMLMLDQLELEQSMHGGRAAFVEGEAWYGKDFDKLWLKAEGEASGGKLRDLRTEALWAHAVAPYWNTQLGVRHDFGVGLDRNWIAFGIEGLAPYWLETEATIYAGQAGRTAARVQVKYDGLLTQRLVLQPMFESNAHGNDDPQRGIGAGLSDASFGLRLRYEISRQFAPYIGVQWMRKFEKTARYARDAGESVSDTRFVAGVRLWF